MTGLQPEWNLPKTPAPQPDAPLEFVDEIPPPPPRPAAWLKPMMAELRKHPGATILVRRNSRAGAAHRYHVLHRDITFTSRQTHRDPDGTRRFDIFATLPLPTPEEEKRRALQARRRAR